MRRACTECGARSTGTRCVPHQRAYQARTYAYNTRAWRALRAAQLALHPLCVDCGKPATDADHVTPARQGGSVLASRCHPCHARKTARFDGSLGHVVVPRGRAGSNV